MSGIADETDYAQALITPNNSNFQLKQQFENISPGYASLKELLSYPPELQFSLVLDMTQMMQQKSFDTTQLLLYENRIEYKQLQTIKNTAPADLSQIIGISVIEEILYNFHSARISREEQFSRRVNKLNKLRALK